MYVIRYFLKGFIRFEIIFAIVVLSEKIWIEKMEHKQNKCGTREGESQWKTKMVDNKMIKDVCTY